jgi:Kef-type K+ transport system membrane component KefB
MFLVGLEFDPALLRGRGDTAIVTSHVSIVAPFLLGAGLALYLYPRLSDRSVTFTGFSLFVGAAMSVTAFPVLARILTERNLLKTRVGAVTIACAAVGDATAWSILALVIAIVRQDAVERPLWVTFAGTGAYVAAMVFGVRRLLPWLAQYRRVRGRLTQDLLAGVVLLALLSGWTTEWLGIHALFGAFVMGAVMPKEHAFVRDVTTKLEDLTVVLLLPVFFASTGLRTRVGLVAGGDMWLYTVLVFTVAVAGKFGGSTIAARMTGLGWREAGALGILMNTRGLMELVIATIGLELGVISPALFAMLVLMAIVTTLMTTPALEALYPARRMRAAAIGPAAEARDYVVVVPVSLPSSGPRLLDVVRAMAPEGRPPLVYALYLDRPADQSLMHIPAGPAGFSDEVLAPLLAAATAARVRAQPLSFVSNDVGRDIVEVAQAKRAELILLGWHKPILSRSILSGTVHRVMTDATGTVAVYVDRQASWKRVLVPYLGGAHDLAAIEIARRATVSLAVPVTILHVVPPRRAPDAPRALRHDELDADPRVVLKVIEGTDPLDAAIAEARRGYDLVISGVAPRWGLVPNPFGDRHERLARETTASLLLVRTAR